MSSAKPRLGFLGVGWIGRDRMAGMLATGEVEAAALVEPNAEMRDGASALAPRARVCATYEEMLGLGLDGIVIATPSAFHAGQSIRALEAGVAVFCQKPLGRDAAEVARVVAAAEAADRLLAVDLSYRDTAATAAVAPLVRDGALGTIQFVDLVFHNAYGPDKPWFYDKVQSGGGCLIDLGVHLLDLALWTLGWPEVVDVTADLFAGGAQLVPGRPGATVEDLAIATLRLAGGAVVRLACSWRLHAGQDAVIGADFYGSEGSAGFHNEAGSFFDFTAEHRHGTARTILTTPPDNWGIRVAAEWARRLATGDRFDGEAHHLVKVASGLDDIYRAAAEAGQD